MSHRLCAFSSKTSFLYKYAKNFRQRCCFHVGPALRTCDQQNNNQTSGPLKGLSRNVLPIKPGESNDVSEEGKSSIARAIYNTYRDPATNTLKAGAIIDAIKKTGIRQSDPRLSVLFSELGDIRREVGKHKVTIENLELDLATFTE